MQECQRGGECQFSVTDRFFTVSDTLCASKTLPSVLHAVPSLMRAWSPDVACCMQPVAWRFRMLIRGSVVILMMHFLQWVESLGFSTWVRESGSVWSYP